MTATARKPVPALRSKSLIVGTSLLAVGWTATLTALLIWDYHQIDEQASTLAVVDAKASYERDLTFRRWVASHGGVYVPVSPQTPPNPLLAHVQERDVTTPSGRSLTLMNSAFISRQMHEWYERPGDLVGHVTSLNPLRPENAPDTWEAEALLGFERGEQEALEVSTLAGKKYMRLMRPVLTEPQCLKCHVNQGYQEGDILGGISVSVPMAEYESAAAARRSFSGVAYSILWLLGMTGIGTAGLLANRRAQAQRAADLALLESERKFRAIFNQSFHLAGVLTPDGAVMDVNNCALETVGTSLDEMKGRPFWEGPWWQHAPEAQRQVRQAIEVAASQGITSRFETTYVDAEGTTRNVDFLLRPVKDDAGRTLLLVPEGQDITEKKKAAEEKVRLTEQLLQAQRLESLGRLAGGLAHDFNNMLAPVMAYADILLTGKPEDHPDRPGLEAIRESAARARNLTQQLLACSRRQSLQTRPMSLNRVIANFEKILRHTLREDITLELRLQQTLGLIEGDAGQIEQVLLNLAINAQDAMPQGGRLVIETSEVKIDPHACSETIGVPAGKYLLLSVSDEGTGMDQQTAARVFEPFFTTKEPGQGTGLGLSTVYGITRQHGGHVELQTETGRGTTLKLYLPLPRLAETPPAENRPARPAGSTKTILLVEDNDQLRRLVRRMLADWGYEVMAAETGQAALAMASAHPGPIHLLLTDLILPDLNGKELHAKVVAARPDLDVLYMSGYTADIIEDRNELPVEVHFIAKPFSPDELASAIRAILDHKNGGGLPKQTTA